MNIIELCDIKTKHDIIHEYSGSLKSDNPPIIIDNGSYQCRVGWSICTEPLLTFRNLIAKPRKDRKKDAVDVTANPPIQIGNDIINIEALRFQLKTQFDRNVVTHFQNQEQIFDYIFLHLGIDCEGSVPHPVLITEAIGNPNYCRQQMNELLFECYGVPGVCYGIDALHSFKRNDCGPDGLIISFGYTTTHVIPVLHGKLVAHRARRLNIGGYHIITYLFRLMQMKYPVHLNAVTISRMETLMHQHSSVAVDYMHDIKQWAQVEHYEKYVKRIQLPYVTQAPTIGTLTAEQKFEKRKEMTRRLLEANAKRTKQKLEEDEQQLQIMEEIASMHESGNVDACELSLKEHGIGSLDELVKIMEVLRARIERLQQKVKQPVDMQNFTIKEKTPVVVPQPPQNVPITEWVNEVKNKRDQLMERKHARKLRRQNLAKRRTAAAQERMRIISLLARKEKGVDDFGIHDGDWDVYKAISRDNDTDSEVENERLIEYEDILRHHDPTFREPVLLPAGAAENYQLHFGVEAIRAPELLFQPSMIGSSEAGLAELIDFVVKPFPHEQQQRLVQNVFMTGGCANLQGMKERLSKELLEMLPFKMQYNISIAKIPELDAWLGARDLAYSEDFVDSLTSKKEFEENGSEYFKSHQASNYYNPTPEPLLQEPNKM